MRLILGFEELKFILCIFLREFWVWFRIFQKWFFYRSTVSPTLEITVLKGRILYSTVPVQSSGHPLIEPTLLSGHQKGCTRSASSRENWGKVLGGLNGRNTISAIQMWIYSFFNEYKSRGIYIIIQYALPWLVLLIINLIEFITAIDIKYSVYSTVQVRWPFIACVSLSPNVVALRSRFQL